MKLFFVLSLTIGITCVSSADISTLKLVQTVFRHGERTPKHSSESVEPYKSLWYGSGLLDRVGMKDHRRLGEYFRKEYDRFLPARYSAAHISAQSSDFQRTIVSAQCTLARLYPSAKEQRLFQRNGQCWQKIPITVVPKPVDWVLHLPFCPTYDEDRAEGFKSAEVVAANAANKDLFKRLTNATAIEVKDISDLHKVQDIFVLQKENNMTIPKWIRNNLEKIEQLNKLSFETAFTKRSAPVKLRGGPLVAKMIENMQDKIKGTSEKLFYMYSAHETKLAPVMAALGVYNDKPPPYSAALIIELHKIKDDYAIKINYRNSSNTGPFTFTIPGCTEMCPFGTFTKLVANMIPTDVAKECKVPPGGPKKKKCTD